MNEHRRLARGSGAFCILIDCFGGNYYDRNKETDDSGRDEEVSEGNKGQNTQGGGIEREENKTVHPTSFQKENKPTDEEILRWIKDGYEVEYILKNWREIRLKETA